MSLQNSNSENLSHNLRIFGTLAFFEVIMTKVFSCLSLLLLFPSCNLTFVGKMKCLDGFWKVQIMWPIFVSLLSQNAWLWKVQIIWPIFVSLIVSKCLKLKQLFYSLIVYSTAEIASSQN